MTKELDLDGNLIPEKEAFLKFMDDDPQWDHGPVKSKKRYEIPMIKSK